MKRAVLILGASLLSTGCAFAPYQTGPIYSDMKAPLAVRDNNVSCPKKGKAEQINVLGIVSIGDASVAAAKKDGGISRVGTVDYHYNTVLGLFGKTTTEVCGD